MSPQAAPVSPVLSEGGDGDDGDQVRENHGIPTDEGKRRKFFTSKEKRQEFFFEKGRCYQFDFHNGYIDWKDYALKLPGFSLSVLRWINDRTHTLRFVMKNRTSGKPYLVVTFRLMFGEELERETTAAGTGVQSSEDPEDSTPISSSRETKQPAFDVATTAEAGQVENNDHGNATEAYIAPATPPKAGNGHVPPPAEACIGPEESAEADDDTETSTTKMPATIDTEANSNGPPYIEASSTFTKGDHVRSDTSSAAEATNLTERMESTTIHEESPSGPESRGYKHSIEESLCSTASADGQGKSMHMFE